MKIKAVHVIVIVLVALSAIFAYDAFTSYINPYLTVSQVAGNDRYIGKEVQILDTVATGSLNLREDGSLLFDLTDGQATIAVTYSGIPPQGLKEGQKIVVIGMLTSPSHVNATQLLVKCPSKYE
ncbi:MAG: cytochrome c maturation protein CcmE [Methanophagales archaeon]|nr:cytochrome c maturation protein CcmE [Methanophagales archaeon]